MRWHVVAGAGLAMALAAPCGARAQNTVGESSCLAEAHGSVSTTWASRGELVTVRTNVVWTCPDPIQPYHLAVVVDAPALAAGDDARIMRENLTTLVARMDLVRNDTVRVGLVGFGRVADTLASLSGDPDRVVAAVARLEAPGTGVPVGRGGLAAGVREGLKMLRLGDAPLSDSERVAPLRQGMVVVAAPGEDAGGADYCADLDTALAEARHANVEVTPVCLTQGWETSCLVDHFTRVVDFLEWDVVRLKEERIAWRSRLRADHLDITEILQDGLVVDPSTIDAGPGTYSIKGQQIHWNFDVREFDDATLTFHYAVRPTVAGWWRVRPQGYAFLLDTHDEVGGPFDLPILELNVSDDRVYRQYFPQALQRPLARPAPWSPPKTLKLP